MNILIVKLGSLGDVLQTTPLIRALATKHRVYYLTYEQNRALIANNPHLFKVLVIKKITFNKFFLEIFRIILISLGVCEKLM